MKWSVVVAFFILANIAVCGTASRTPKDEGSNQARADANQQHTPAPLPTVANDTPNGSLKRPREKGEHPVSIAPSPLPVQSIKDVWDKALVILTGLLVIVSGFQMWYLYRTIKAIKEQASIMERSTAATEKSVKLQEIQSMQWIDVIGIQTHVNSVQGKIPEGTTQTPLFVNFDIVNPTGMILTLNWVIIRIDGERQPPRLFDHPLNPSSDPVTINTSIILEGMRLEAYGKYALGISVIVYVGYRDALNKPRKQHFSCMCVCGPPASTRISPYQGIISEDDIQEGERKNTN
jgi:hypothetical protein